MKSSTRGRIYSAAGLWLRSGCLVLVTAAALVACSSGGTVEGFLAEATAYEEAGDFAAAALELKNAIQLDPDNQQARSKLGYLHLKLGDFAAAKKELERAKRLGNTEPRLNQSIVKALIMLGEHDQAATELALNGDFQQFEWRNLQASLDLRVGRYEDARDTFAALLKEQPDNAEVRASLVGSLLEIGEFDEAKRVLNEAIEADVSNATLWIIKGQLAVLDQDYAQAAAAYQRALEVEPSAYPAMLGRIVAAVGQERYDAAGTFLDALPEGASGDLRVTYLRGVVAEGQGLISQALTHYRAVIQQYPDHQEALQKLARLHFESGETARSIEYLQRLTALYPENRSYRKQLGAAQLAAGRLDNAFEELVGMDLNIEEQTDANLLALLGSAYSKQGQYDEGIESLQRAHELAPDSTPIAIELALSHLRSGTISQATEILQSALEREPDNQTVYVLAILAYSGEEPEKAKSLMDTMIANRPAEGLPLNIRGFLRMRAGDLENARKDFESAIEVEREFLPPYFNLARIEMAQGNASGAMSQLEKVLQVDGDNSQAFLALGELATRVGKPELAVNYWERAHESDKDAATPRAALARYYRANGQVQKAREFIVEAFEIAPYQPLVLYEYAQTHLILGETEKAAVAIDKLSARFPDSLRVLDLQVAFHRSRGNEDKLTEALNRVLQLAPNAVKPRQVLVSSLLRQQDFTRAREVAKELQEVDNGEAAASELLGDISFAENDYRRALNEYEAGFKQAPTSQLVLKLDITERRLGQSSDRLEKWYSEHPDDRAVRFQLATNKHAAGDVHDAKNTFEELYTQNPDNPVVLNNLAWVYHELDDERALEFAKKANTLSPGNPEIMDTYAWILLANGNIEQAIKLLNEAILKAPNNPDIRFHYAKALVEVGQDKLAIEELSQVLGEDKEEFASMAEAEALLRALQPGS
ncbi:MAG: XrtA/PEP-CTERM system TPR-repeat protein PrsT [Gammaproteobacteria bacterium]